MVREIHGVDYLVNHSSVIWEAVASERRTYIDVVPEALQRKNSGLATDIAKDYVGLDAEDTFRKLGHEEDKMETFFLVGIFQPIISLWLRVARKIEANVLCFLI